MTMMTIMEHDDDIRGAVVRFCGFGGVDCYGRYTDVGMLPNRSALSDELVVISLRWMGHVQFIHRRYRDRRLR